MRRVAVVLAALALTLVSPLVAVAVEHVTFYVVEPRPFGIVSDPLDGRLYVATSGASTAFGTGHINVIDPTTREITTLDTTKASSLLALDSAGRRLYASNYVQANDGVSLDIIDLNTGGTLQSLELGGLGVALDTTRSRVFVAGGRYLAAIDTNTFDVQLRTAPSTQVWFGVATDPGLGRIYVTNIDSVNPSLVVLDASDLHTIANVSLPSSARFALAVDPATHDVYIAGANNSDGTGGTLSALDPVTFALRTSATGFYPGGMTLEPAAHRIWITNLTRNGFTAFDDRTLLLAEPHTFTQEPPYFLTFGRDGLLYVADFGGSLVEAFRVDAPNTPPVFDLFTIAPESPVTDDLVTATVQARDPEGGDVTLTYTWTVNGIVLAEESGATLDLAEPGHGDRGDMICLTVIASDGEGQTTEVRCLLRVRNSAPIAAVSIDDTSPLTDAVLRATASVADADGGAFAYTYTWRVNGAVVHELTSESASSTLDLSLSGHGDAGDTVEVTLVVSDDVAQLSLPASASVVVANTAPLATVSLSDERAKKQDLVTATVVATDDDAQALTYAYEWRLNGALIQASTSTSATDAFDLKAAGATIGDVVTVDVVVSDGTASATAFALATITPAGH
jgi:DNA-binding beta-propeller fold protein YncE